MSQGNAQRKPEPLANDAQQDAALGGRTRGKFSEVYTRLRNVLGYLVEDLSKLNGEPASYEALNTKPEVLTELWFRYVRKLRHDWLPSSLEMSSLVEQLELMEKLIGGNWPLQYKGSVFDHLARSFAQMLALLACGVRDERVWQALPKSQIEEIEGGILNYLHPWAGIRSEPSPFPTEFLWAMERSLDVDLPKGLPRILYELDTPAHRPGLLRSFVQIMTRRAREARECENRDAAAAQRIHAHLWSAPASFVSQCLEFLATELLKRNGNFSGRPAKAGDKDADCIADILDILADAVSLRYPQSIEIFGQILHRAGFVDKERLRKGFEDHLGKIHRDNWATWTKWTTQGGTNDHAQFRRWFRAACDFHRLRSVLDGQFRRVERFKVDGALHPDYDDFVPYLVAKDQTLPVSGVSRKCKLLDVSEDLSGVRFEILPRSGDRGGDAHEFNTDTLTNDCELCIPYPGSEEHGLGGRREYLRLHLRCLDCRENDARLRVRGQAQVRSGDRETFFDYYRRRFGW